MTQLLVSVSSLEEAHAALSGGCRWIDFKDPHQGSLGMLDPLKMAECVEVIRNQFPGVTLSAALGEAAGCSGRGLNTAALNWGATGSASAAAIMPRPNNTALALDQTGGSRPPLALALPELVAPEFSTAGNRRPPTRIDLPLDYVKLGTSGVAPERTWNFAVKEITLAKSTNWVGVIYADLVSFGSETADRLVDAFQSRGAPYILVDTFEKNALGLFDHWSPKQLTAFRQSLDDLGLKLALAGKLRLSDVPRLQEIEPEVVAVRSAVCESGRTSLVRTELVAQFLQRMENIGLKPSRICSN